MPESSSSGSSLRPLLVIGGYVLLGMWPVAYLWDVVNHALALNVSLTQLLIAIPVAAVLGVILWRLTHTVTRLLDTPEPSPEPSSAPPSSPSRP